MQLKYVLHSSKGSSLSQHGTLKGEINAKPYEEPTHWKRPWCWERLREGGEGEIEDEMVGWHHQLNGQDFEQTPGDSEGQGCLACCSPWSCKELDTTSWMNVTTTPNWCWAGLKDSPQLSVSGHKQIVQGEVVLIKLGGRRIESWVPGFTAPPFQGS